MGRTAKALSPWGSAGRRTQDGPWWLRIRLPFLSGVGRMGEGYPACSRGGDYSSLLPSPTSGRLPGGTEGGGHGQQPSLRGRGLPGGTAGGRRPEVLSVACASGWKVEVGNAKGRTRLSRPVFSPALAQCRPSCLGPSGSQKAVSWGLCPDAACSQASDSDVSGLETGVTTCNSLHGEPPRKRPHVCLPPSKHPRVPPSDSDGHPVGDSAGGRGAAPSVQLGGLNEMMRVQRAVRAPVTQYPPPPCLPFSASKNIVCCFHLKYFAQLSLR